jgi:hypothetical protein
MMSMLLTLILHVSRLVLVSVSLDFLRTDHGSFPQRLSNVCQGLRRNFSETCTKFDVVRVHREIASRRIHDSK